MNNRREPHIHGRDNMSGEVKAPPSILEEVLEEMFQKLKEGNEFDAKILRDLRSLADSESLIEGNKLLDLIKQGDCDEDPGAFD